MPWQVKMCRCLRCCPAVPISELNHYHPSVCCLKCDEAFDMNQIMSSIFLPRTDYFKFWDWGRLVLFLFLFVLITLILDVFKRFRFTSFMKLVKQIVIWISSKIRMIKYYSNWLAQRSKRCTNCRIWQDYRCVKLV